MPKRTIAAFLLVPTILVAIVLATFLNREGIADRFERPSDDNPRFFCSVPDPAPSAKARGASLILQGCAAGKAFTLPRGETIAVDLASGGWLDAGASFHDLTVSDPTILRTVSAPTAIRAGGTVNGAPSFDYVAVYKGVRSGLVTINALYRTCFQGSCNDMLRWEATVQVS